MEYKVGDKVRIKSLDWYNKSKDMDGFVHCGDKIFDNYMSVFCGSVVTIGGIYPYNRYDIREDMHCRTWTDEMFEGRVEETKPIDFAIKATDTKGKVEVVIPEGYGYVVENDKLYFITKQGYPKTYEECCRVLGVSEFEYNHTGTNVWYKHKLMATLDKLILCCDAYWKLYGEEMGLGKPWEPDWTNGHQKKYCIYNDKGNIVKYAWHFTNAILVFPTTEMRDAFYDNFKQLIEQCKTLL